jgi:hypothetical protein
VCVQPEIKRHGTDAGRAVQECRIQVCCTDTAIAQAFQAAVVVALEEIIHLNTGRKIFRMDSDFEWCHGNDHGNAVALEQLVDFAQQVDGDIDAGLIGCSRNLMSIVEPLVLAHNAWGWLLGRCSGNSRQAGQHQRQGTG